MTNLETAIESRESYTIALRIDPIVRQEIKAYSTYANKIADSCYLDDLYVPLLKLSGRKLSFGDFKDSIMTIVPKYFPRNLKINDYRQQKKRLYYILEESKNPDGFSQEFMVEVSKRNPNKDSPISFQSFHAREILGIEGANYSDIRSIYRELSNKENFLMYMFYSLMFLGRGTDSSKSEINCYAPRIAVFDKDMSLIAEFDSPRNRWIGTNMAKKSAQWELTRFAMQAK